MESLITAGKVVDTSARLSALEARTQANEKGADRIAGMLEKAQTRADEVLTKRFDAANEVRGAMQDASKTYVTRAEFQWAMGAVVLLLIGMVIKFLMT